MKVRQKGGHVIYHHPDCRRTLIPIHLVTAINPYLPADILHRLKIDEPECLDAIKRR
jgi:predicted RNA binding protein YcfA (HicA-like mRNA interferase family)